MSYIIVRFVCYGNKEPFKPDNSTQQMWRPVDLTCFVAFQQKKRVELEHVNEALRTCVCFMCAKFSCGHDCVVDLYIHMFQFWADGRVIFMYRGIRRALR